MPDPAGRGGAQGHPAYWSSAARTWTAPSFTPGALAFHRTLPGYAPTPLVDAPALARELGVRQVLVKDESRRLGLPAFKVLGASWACHQVQDRTPGAALVAATDGNHGRAVAWMARHHGVPATVFVPAVMLPATAELITGEGASVVRVDGDDDEAVRRAAAFACAAPGRALVQDTTWPGYTDVPEWIVEGYRTLVREVDEQLAATATAADLVVVPVGVGSLAQAVVRHYRQPAGPARASCRSNRRPRPAVDDLAGSGVRTGPCGGATLAGIRAALGDLRVRDALDLPPHAVLVLLSTEGTTP